MIADTGTVPPQPWRFPQRLELVKWIAFAGMLLDHVDLVLFDRGQPWMHQIGAFCLPVFALSFGIGLAHTADAFRVARRLLLPAIVAQAAWVMLQDHPANVLAMFAGCAVVVGLVQNDSRWASTALVLLAIVSVAGEGGPPLVALVAGGYTAARFGRDWPLLLAGALWVGCVPSIGAALAVIAARWWPPGGGPRIARKPGALAWGYALHLVALWVVLALAGGIRA